MKIQDLKPGDSIKHRHPYPGEGEKIIADLERWPGRALVITALAEDGGKGWKAANGSTEYLAHDIIENYYEKVPA
jgi:hypothetical protein